MFKALWLTEKILGWLLRICGVLILYAFIGSILLTGWLADLLDRRYQRKRRKEEESAIAY